MGGSRRRQPKTPAGRDARPGDDRGAGMDAPTRAGMDARTQRHGCRRGRDDALVAHRPANAPPPDGGDGGGGRTGWCLCRQLGIRASSGRPPPTEDTTGGTPPDSLPRPGGAEAAAIRPRHGRRTPTPPLPGRGTTRYSGRLYSAECPTADRGTRHMDGCGQIGWSVRRP